MTKISWRNERRKINDLVPAEYNPRQMTEKQAKDLKKSLEKFDLVEIPAIDTDGTIIAGHQRIAILKQLGRGEEEIDVRVPNRKLTEKEQREYNLRSNKNTGEFDFDKLAEFDKDLLLDVGFDSAELDKIFQVDISEDVVPEVRPDPQTKLGDLWILGDHRLLCGDATKKEDVERLMDGEKAEMCFTDPPYELETRGGGILKKAKSMREIRENGLDTFDPSKLLLWAKTNVFCCNRVLVPEYIELARQSNVSWDICLYHKSNVAPNYGGHLMTDVEYLMIIGESEPVWATETHYLMLFGDQNPNKGLKKDFYSKVFYGRADTDAIKSYIKPIALVVKFLLLFSNLKNIILDSFGGSGTTLIACERTGRKCRMMEIDPGYCDVIITRWENLTGKKAEKIEEK